jgi:hypothetical protein
VEIEAEIPQCPLCDYASHDSSNMKRHVLSHKQQEEKSKFPFCDFVTNERTELKTHVFFGCLAATPASPVQPKKRQRQSFESELSPTAEFYKFRFEQERDRRRDERDDSRDRNFGRRRK